ncbi:MAG: DUF4097 family beta strand repeat-containing protein [Candidatus Riflebacteria bacterium]|nr:DUF4097 family beta strand repeat-containing protein [Candidatus Riflebacteria bacterium]
MTDARKMILNMLAEGKITVEESEKLLAAINEKDNPREEPKAANRDENRENNGQRSENEESGRSREKNNDDDPFNPFLNATKLGFDLRNLAQTVQQTVQHAIKKAEPRRREFKDKMKEFGSWMQEVVGSMANELGNVKGEPTDGLPVDFVVTPPENIDRCDTFVFENVFGEIRIHEGPEFKMHVNGQVSKATMGEYQPAQWFSRYGIRTDDRSLFVGFDRNLPVKAIIDMEITLPADMHVNCKTVSGAMRIRGNYRIGELKTVSGNIRIQGANLKQSQIETVSGAVQIEGGEISMEIKSTSGDFLVRDSRIEELKINSVSGDIMLTEASISDNTSVRLATTSGDIIVEKMSGPWKVVEATTRSGDVVLDWKGDATPLNNQGTSLKSGSNGAEFKAESVSGDIQFT